MFFGRFPRLGGPRETPDNVLLLEIRPPLLDSCHVPSVGVHGEGEAR